MSYLNFQVDFYHKLWGHLDHFGLFGVILDHFERGFGTQTVFINRFRIKTDENHPNRMFPVIFEDFSVSFPDLGRFSHMISTILDKWYIF